MKTYYDLIDYIYNYLNGNQSINTVTIGDVMDVDLTKQTIFPLAHINVGSVTFDEHIVTFNITVMAMDIVDESKEDKLSLAKPHLGLDNKQDILNTMLTVVNGLQSSLRRGGLYDANVEIDSPASASLFEDRFENLLTGWSMDLAINMPNSDMGLINSDGSTNCQ
jgi:hypothetical protein